VRRITLPEQPLNEQLKMRLSHRRWINSVCEAMSQQRCQTLGDFAKGSATGKS
jgi:hypothetical protein